MSCEKNESCCKNSDNKTTDKSGREPLAIVNTDKSDAGIDFYDAVALVNGIRESSGLPPFTEEEVAKHKKDWERDFGPVAEKEAESSNEASGDSEGES